MPKVLTPVLLAALFEPWLPVGAGLPEVGLEVPEVGEEPEEPVELADEDWVVLPPDWFAAVGVEPEVALDLQNIRLPFAVQKQQTELTWHCQKQFRRYRRR